MRDWDEPYEKFYRAVQNDFQDFVKDNEKFLFEEDPRPMRKKVEKHWIQKSIKHPGALRAELGIKEGHTIPLAKLDKATHSSKPIVREQANLAKTLRGFHKT
jgi:hypothetical protein